MKKNKTELNIYDAVRMEAIKGYLENDSGYHYRRICRWFSKTFHTPLVQVLEMPLEFILLHYEEAQLDSADYDDVYNAAVDLYVPEITEDNDAQYQEYLRDLEEEQKEQLRIKTLKNPPPKQSLRSEPQTPPNPTPDIHMTFEDEEP